MIAREREEPVWHLAYVMPNLAPSTRGEAKPTDETSRANLFWRGVTLDTDSVAIVSMRDARVQRIVSRDKKASKLFHSFVDTDGKKLHPSVVIFRDDSPFTKEEEGIVAFRNCVALSVTLHARAAWARGNSGPGWSDYFDFHPLQLREHGLVAISAALTAFFSEKAKYQAMPSPYVSATGIHVLYPDRFLHASLGLAWRSYYERPTDRTRFGRALFRSLELAYLASASPIKHGGSMYETGVHIALWISAIEVLVSALYKKTDQWNALDLLGEYEWGDYRPALKKQIETLRFVKGKTETLRSVNMVQHACHLVYTARHKFLHGAKIKEKELWPWGTEDREHGEPAPTVAIAAPIVYRIALHAFLSRKYKTRSDDSEETNANTLPDGVLYSEYDYSEALKAIYRIDDDDPPENDDTDEKKIGSDE